MIIPVILCGGIGSRLWPISRQSKPKQFVKLMDDHSLFQNTVLRCGEPPFSDTPIVVGSNANRFLILEDLEEIGKEADILLEPVAKNTCPAIASACLHALSRDENAKVMVMAADHLISDSDTFLESVIEANKIVDENFLVTFGVKPTRPETGYGYIKLGKQNNNAIEVEAFVEKPNRETALKYVDEGYLWNSGNFAFKAQAFLSELAKLNEDVLKHVKQAYERKQSDLSFLRLDEKSFAACPSISIDNGVMELSNKVAVIPVSYSWSDLGDWQELANLGEQDDAGNALFGKVHTYKSNNNIVHSNNSLTVLFGMQNTIVANTKDVVLIANKDNSQAIKQLVEHLSCEEFTQVSEGVQEFKPWGNYEQLDVGDCYKVKRIIVKPGGKLSLQKHKHRAEHWVVVSGTAEVTIDDKISHIKPNQSLYVPQNTVHRLANRGREPVILIEVQTGDYLGEDDIERLDDVYNR